MRIAQAQVDRDAHREQRRGVDEERRAQPEPGQGAAHQRPAHRADQEARRPQARHPPALFGRRDADHQRQRRHGEHRRADAAHRAQNQELPITLGQRARSGGHRDDHQAGQVHPALPQPLHQPTTDRREQQPHQRERADDRGRGRHSDAEAARELRQHRSHQPESDGDDERGSDQHPDLTGQASGSRARQRPGSTAHPSAPCPPSPPRPPAPGPGAHCRGTTPRRSCTCPRCRTDAPRTRRSPW